jgi:hypothetical protein
MSSLSAHPVRHGPQLRLLRGARGTGRTVGSPRDEPPTGGPARKRSRILVAGADPKERAAVLRDLSETLPPDTQFGEAGAVSEVLEQAPSSGVVMLAGDLEEVSAESLIRLLGDRHPSLPVVALGTSPNPPARTGMATVRR